MIIISYNSCYLHQSISKVIDKDVAYKRLFIHYQSVFDGYPINKTISFDLKNKEFQFGFGYMSKSIKFSGYTKTFKQFKKFIKKEMLDIFNNALELLFENPDTFFNEDGALIVDLSYINYDRSTSDVFYKTINNNCYYRESDMDRLINEYLESRSTLSFPTNELNKDQSLKLLTRYVSNLNTAILNKQYLLYQNLIEEIDLLAKNCDKKISITLFYLGNLFSEESIFIHLCLLYNELINLKSTQLCLRLELLLEINKLLEHSNNLLRLENNEIKTLENIKDLFIINNSIDACIIKD